MIAAAHPFLMFQGRCEEALNAYVAAIPGARITALDRKPDGTVAMARLTIAGLEILANDSPPVHDFDFTPSTSIFLTVGSEAQLDQIAAALAAEGGALLMPPGDYGFSTRFAWVKDRFGPSWQINCA
jgi:predicted 3-demethylubiquinone-9 3-methyltransferase (glyoxalase superfamily)